MRIRSIKPEFWRSDDVTALDWPTRLLFIGMWSYVDDSGVGIDDERRITADLFGLEENPVEIRRIVRDGLATLSRRSLITRFTNAGRAYLAITKWSEHQKIDKPGRKRYPDPDEPGSLVNKGLEEQGAPMERSPRESVATSSRLEQGNRGTGEQGNRGTGEQGIPTTSGEFSPAEIALVEPSDTTHSIVAEWMERCTKRPPAAVIGQTSKAIRLMLEEGIGADDVRRGLAQWMAKGLHPSALPSAVNEVMNARPIPRRSTTDARVLDALALADRLESQQRLEIAQ